ncbi:TAP-like protein-domain-containing protein [Schizothecium vesticola]|uniref:TAP-like protein-domain-containing protein n=1 Tax=Schizothecium vesticola TaxID=314040 RepID=A0AA40K949_9PEZI|nr:TAP-like protein-domain-containing protein [Schizothecium vesticola]
MTLLGLLALASLASASPINDALKHQSRAESSIKWGPCPFNSSTLLPHECGTLTVPLDHSDPESTATLTLSLLRSRAVAKGGSKGSILFNFGGPGYPALKTLSASAVELHNRTGGQYDLVAGTGQTMPFSCFNTSAERAIAYLQYPSLPVNAYPNALVDNWANAEALNNVCATKNKNSPNGTLIGTAFVVRDMMNIVDALGEDGKLRFWGLSYGTVLGMTAAAMFPDRIDRLVLDGVVNVHNYYERFGIDADQLLSADGGWTALLQECIDAGTEKCALADVVATGEELATVLEDLAEDYKESPVAVGTTVLNGHRVKELYFIVAKYPDPKVVSVASVHIRSLLDKTNLTAVAAYYAGLSSGVAGSDDALSGIKCSDTIPRAKTLEEVRPEIEYAGRSSKFFGNDFQGLTLSCATWPWKAKEVYGGEFGGKTPKGVLFIGNTYDVATSMIAAHAMGDLFEGSAVLEQKGFGHTSLAQASKCSGQVVAKYFLDGTLPEKGKICDVDVSLF